MSGRGCLPAGELAALSRVCRDGAAAARLKTGSLLAILIASAVGVCLPVALTRAFRGRDGYARGLLLVKCYAAGVILSTSLVHVLPDAYAALADCAVASRRPWRDFPFAGLLCLVGALLALLVDLSASSHLEAHGLHQQPQQQEGQPYAPIPTTKKAPVFELTGEMSPRKRAFLDESDRDDPAPRDDKNGGDPDRDDVALFGPKKGGRLPRSDEPLAPIVGCHGAGHEVVEVGEGEEEEARKKQKMVSKVLEIGIVFHSVIIGVTLGMSQDVCAIRPLVVALSFHQVFEGMGLGGCIAQAGFGMATVGYMCIMFSVTTPLGILLGMAVFHMTGYDDSSPNALIIEGLLGSLSAGILVYMALVDLISLDFFHNKMMSSSLKLKKASYIALVLGSASMSILALWA
ncbi:zinc transporter 6 [Hordeum vulgare]|uniref:Zinc transporter 6, chloroplastic n=1 Tax=Hordeum vulgare subsp. vulgare TaxID=112509 RepID=A0A8I6WEL2_HORVV|nr:zinc transporter 6 [Hordeum vulgare subsp. vulgare]KAE8797788.1 zinc transporter 6 [Hordeum vulgare]